MEGDAAARAGVKITFFAYLFCAFSFFNWGGRIRFLCQLHCFSHVYHCLFLECFLDFPDTTHFYNSSQNQGTTPSPPSNVHTTPLVTYISLCPSALSITKFLTLIIFFSPLRTIRVTAFYCGFS